MVRARRTALGDVFGDRLLVLGAHPDDCELMAGGLLVRWSGPKRAVVVTTMARSNPARQAIRDKEISNAMRAMRVADYEVGSHPDADLVHDGTLTRYVDRLVRDFRPTLVVAHKPDDFHQDHRAIAQAVEAALRRSRATLLQGESYLWPLPSPNLYVDISGEIEAKLRALRAYRSIIANETFDPDAVEAFHRMRGTQTFRFHHAEAFRFLKGFAT